MKIEIKNLSFAYDKNPVLNNINLSYDSKDFLSIIGPNGGGKTTLLKLIVGLLKSKKGEITFDGSKEYDISKIVGYVPQIIPLNHLFPMSVLDVVLMGRCTKKTFCSYSKKDKELAKEALRLVSMQDFLKRKIGALSGGQRQRVYIARALCTQAKILILDEPTASIDPKGQAEIYEILQNINAKGVGIIMISHDINMAINFANKVAYVNGELFLHEIDENTKSANSKKDLIQHLASHNHFCDVEILTGKCTCQGG